MVLQVILINYLNSTDTANIQEKTRQHFHNSTNENTFRPIGIKKFVPCQHTQKKMRAKRRITIARLL